MSLWEICNLVNLDITNMGDSSVNFGKNNNVGAREQYISLGSSQVVGDGNVNTDNENNYYFGCKKNMNTPQGATGANPTSKNTSSSVTRKILHVVDKKKRKKQKNKYTRNP